MANSVDPDQTAPIGAVCCGSTLVGSILNSSVILGNYLQQTTSADDLFLGASRVKRRTREDRQHTVKNNFNFTPNLEAAELLYC